MSKPRFSLGSIAFTAAVHDAGCQNDDFGRWVGHCISRHLRCDWGDLCDEDKQLNEEALCRGGRLLSKYNYRLNDDLSIYIITETDRSATTVLFPYEY